MNKHLNCSVASDFTSDSTEKQLKMTNSVTFPLPALPKQFIAYPFN